jgi:hypothetical protein
LRVKQGRLWEQKVEGHHYLLPSLVRTVKVVVIETGAHILAASCA